jgi:NADH-quinone oxidoreductase subunit M
MLWMLQKVNLGEPKPEWNDHTFHDVDRFELAAWVPLIILIVIVGLYPRVIFGASTDAVVELVGNAFGPGPTAALPLIGG